MYSKDCPRGCNHLTPRRVRCLCRTLPTRAQYEATQHAIDDLSEDQLASLILKKPPAKPKHGDFGLTDANQPVHHLAVSKTDSAWARKAHLPPIESAAAQDEPLSPKLEILGSSRAEKVSPPRSALARRACSS